MIHPPTASHSGDSAPAPQDVAITANDPQRPPTAPQEPPARDESTHTHRDYTAAHIDDSDLDVYARRLLHHINRREGERPCTRTTSDMAAVCCMGEGTVSDRRDRLAKKGYIIVEDERPPNAPYRIRIAPDIKGDISTSRRLDEAGLSPHAFALFHRILRRSGSNGSGCYEKQKNIAPALSTTVKQLRKARDELKERGFITAKRQKTILIHPCPPSEWKAKEGDEPTSNADDTDDTASPATKASTGQDTPQDAHRATEERQEDGDPAQRPYDHAEGRTRTAFCRAYDGDGWAEEYYTDRDYTPYEAIRQHPAVAMLADNKFGGYYDKVLSPKYTFQLGRIAEAVTDFNAWFAVLEYWTGPHRPENLGGMLDRYHRYADGGDLNKWKPFARPDKKASY